MKDEKQVIESFEKALTALVARVPPEQWLAGLAPEQRLAGLTEAQAVLALPDAMLRALSAEYIATLPRETQAAIQKRLGAASGRRPARRRVPRSPSR
ncbi:hypothetical protein [Sorangium sp. So ce145]|uniref:hypothetical protein n=1 Tax=Sorangium sp. So ce145 TaxID=3133285 RepID=UPI003F63A9D0